MSTPANPGSIVHQLADWRFILQADGSLTITPASGDTRRKITIGPDVAFALGVFVRMPGARALMNRCDLERQHERHEQRRK
jgi:hypothetical protein